MSDDILTELRGRAAAIERQGETDWFYDDAADEIERLRAEIALLRADNNRRALLEAGLRYGIERYREAIRRIAEQDATLSVCEGNVTVEMDATLTDDERESVHFILRHAAHAADHSPFPDSADYIAHHKAVSAMMERLK